MAGPKTPRTIRILVVDDIPLMRTMLVKYVHTLGRKILEIASSQVEIEVIEAPNGRVALDKLGSSAVDMVFLDMMMPEMDGLTFLDEKRQVEDISDIPVIVCSAVGESRVVEQARELGAVSYVTKPFKLASLEIEFRRTLEGLIA